MEVSTLFMAILSRTKEPMSDGGKRNVNFVMTEEVLQCQDQAAWGLLQPKQTN